MISKRKLTRWRKEALVEVDNLNQIPEKEKDRPHIIYKVKVFSQILQMTQELLDQYLLKEERDEKS